MEAKIRTHLKTLLPAPEDLQRMVAGTGPDGVHPNRGWVYDAELGFIHGPSIHSGNGVNGTNTFYDYEEDGARKIVIYADRPCRIHTYGDSFTHCDQVNDGETWQEYLAAHLQEPIRNYGVGGYSVYQAYRRICAVRDAGQQAEYIILNIFDDDHYRNLISWRCLRGSRSRSHNLETAPHLRVDVGAGTCVEHDHLIARPEDLNKLCDLDYVCSEFGDDPLLYLSLAKLNEGEQAAIYLAGGCERFGLAAPAGAIANIKAAADAVFTEAALYSTRHVVGLVEQFCAENGIKLMFVLSYEEGTIRSVLAGEERFDREFVDWLKGRPHPVIDMCDAFKTEFDHSTFDLDVFMKRYYIGHHTPLGNAVTAWEMMDAVVDWLDPKPLSYQSGVGI